MSGIQTKSEFTELSVDSLKIQIKLQSKTNLCRSLIALNLHLDSTRKQIENISNGIIAFVYKENSEESGSITGVLMHQKNVYIIFLECSYNVQIRFFEDVLMKFKKQSVQKIEKIKLLVFNELFVNRLN